MKSELLTKRFMILILITKYLNKLCIEKLYMVKNSLLSHELTARIKKGKESAFDLFLLHD